jgi:hypothetical protein
MSTKTKKLSDKLTIALAKYYMARFLGESREIGHTTSDGFVIRREYSKPVVWNKDELLAGVKNALPKGWGYAASSGTFWFSTEKKQTIRVNQESWPLGVVEPKKK